MKFPPVALPLVLLLSACAATPTEEELDPAKHQQMMMEKWAEFMTPGPAHKVLDTKVGHWDVVITSYDPPSESKGTSDFRWIMDGRYLEQKAEASFDGAPFHGLGISGFDNLKRAYVSTWVDNMGTGLVNAEGTYAPETRTFTYTADAPDLLSGKYVKSRSTETFVDDDHMKVEFFGKGPEGKEIKMMELAYSRSR